MRQERGQVRPVRAVPGGEGEGADTIPRRVGADAPTDEANFSNFRRETRVLDLTRPDPSRPQIWVRPGRRRQEAVVRHLIDGRLLQRLCGPGSPEGDAALVSFRASLPRLATAAEEGLPPFELTPLALLDVLGVEPPQFDVFPLPPQVLKSGESLMATSVVVKLVESRFRESSKLQPEALKKGAEELRQETAPEALDLFDLCVTRAVSAEKFEDPIIHQLSFDYLCRYPFPDVLREEVFEFLCASLFAAGETVSGLSKMRMIKTLWDRAYPWLLKANPKAREEIQALDREMRLRTRSDYLGWEVVHHAVLGVAAGERFDPVVGYLLDSTVRARTRCIAYKSALRAFLDQIHRNDLAKLRSQLDTWRPGALVPCREDGTCEAPVPTADLPLFVGGKPGAG